jgi:stearoyl-CoA desaturase (delta-9 desaturase)
MHRSQPNWPTGFGLVFIHAGALLVLWPAFFSWPAIVGGAVLAYATGALGITLCYHRTLTHRSVRMVRPLEYALALLGTLAFQGAPIQWVATHRKHHAHSDHDGDPHSIELGFRWAHFSWLVRSNPDVPRGNDLKRYAPDLWSQPYYRALEVLHVPLQIALALALLYFGGWPWLVWAGFARLVFTYHITWLVNSASHSMGYRSYKTADQSTNSWWVALLAFGEGWHNNHHAFPFSARHGMRKREVDVTWWSIKVLQALCLVDRVRVPTEAALVRLRLPKAPSTAPTN